MRYEVYHSDKDGNSIFATSRTRKESAIKVAENIKLADGERVSVLKDKGDMPGDYARIYTRRA